MRLALAVAFLMSAIASLASTPISCGLSASIERAEPAGPDCSAVGEQRVAVILVTFPGIAPPDVSPSRLRDLVFDGDPSMSSAYRSLSYGKTSFYGDVFGPYVLDRAYSCSESNQMRSAAVAAADSDIDFTQYQRVILIFPYIRDCMWGGLSTLGCVTVQTADGEARASWIWANYYPDLAWLRNTLIHEMGHSLGAGHARFLRFPGESLGGDDYRAAPIEYGDFTSPMGSGTPGQFSAAHKLQFGWLDSADIATAESDGEFVLAPGSASSGLRALRIRRRIGAGEWLWLEYGPNGALIRRENEASGVTTNILDMTPAGIDEARIDFGASSERSLELPLNSTWHDAHTALSISLGEVNAEGLPVSVRYTGGCANPSVAELALGDGEEQTAISVDAAPDCDWTVRSGRSWLTAHREGLKVIVRATALPNQGRREGHVTIGRSLVKITQKTQQSGPVFLSVSPRSGGAPVNTEFPLVIYLRHETDVEAIQAVQIAIAGRPGSSAAPCYFRVGYGRATMEVSDDGSSYRESEQGTTGYSGACSLRGIVRMAKPFDLTFQGTLQITAPESEQLAVSIRTEDQDGVAGAWQQHADWTGTRECMVLPAATWNLYLPEGARDSAVPIRSTFSPCAWSAYSDSEWLRLKVFSSNEGSAPRFDMDPNPTSDTRYARLTLNGNPVFLSQRGLSDPASVTLRPVESVVSGLGGRGMLTFSNLLGGAVSASVTSPWLKVTRVIREADRREIEFEFEPNPETEARIGTMVIGGKLFTVLQQGSVAPPED